MSGEPDAGEGYADDYTLEDLEISVADHVQRQTHASFQAAWDALGDANELQVRPRLETPAASRYMCLYHKSYQMYVVCTIGSKFPSIRSLTHVFPGRPGHVQPVFDEHADGGGAAGVVVPGPGGVRAVGPRTRRQEPPRPAPRRRLPRRPHRGQWGWGAGGRTGAEGRR